MGTAALGADGSLSVFCRPHLVRSSANMPVTVGTLQSVCQNDPCGNGCMRISALGWTGLLYVFTYLPGGSTAQLYSDGSVYYAGTAQAGFSDDAQCLPAAECRRLRWYRAIGSHRRYTDLRDLFRGPYMDSIFPIAVAPDGSVWAGVNSEIGCCSLPGQLIHLDAGGSKLLADVPINALDMVVDHAGNLYTFADGAISASPSVSPSQWFLRRRCICRDKSCGTAAICDVSPRRGERICRSRCTGDAISGYFFGRGAGCAKAYRASTRK